LTLTKFYLFVFFSHYYIYMFVIIILVDSTRQNIRKWYIKWDFFLSKINTLDYTTNNCPLLTFWKVPKINKWINISCSPTTQVKYSTQFFLFFLLWCWGLNSGPTPWAIPPALFCDRCFRNRVLGTICLDGFELLCLLSS
jgi:hypothetical protein